MRGKMTATNRVGAGGGATNFPFAELKKCGGGGNFFYAGKMTV